MQPVIGQQVTLIAVTGGEVHVVTGTVLVVGDQSLAVEVAGGTQPPAPDDRVTLLYPGGDRLVRLKTLCVETFKETRWILQPEGPPRPGERRDFYRAMIEVGFKFIDELPEDLAEAQLLVAERAKTASSGDLVRVEADLSASGAKIPSTLRMEKGQRVGLLQEVEPGDGSDIHGAVASVVRSDGSAIAIAFVEPSEALQEQIITAVFRERYGSLGISD